MSAQRYKIVESLGAGNFTAGVYRCRHVDLDREVAVKLLKVHAGIDRTELLREARTMASLGPHDNVVQVLDAGDWDEDHAYLAVELCVGGSLQSLIPERGVDPAMACRLISDSCRGLDYMHRQGLLHLDIRPANILLKDTVPKLIDFGLARWSHDPGVPFVYTPHAAPELLCGGNGSELADQYAIAMTLGHLLTNGLICSDPVPFPVTEKAWRTCHPVQMLGANVPDRLKRVIKKATSFSPQDRYVDIERFKQALDGATPTVSFRYADANNLISSDGCWAISSIARAGRHLTEVKRNGRRQVAYGGVAADDIEALSDLRRVVNVLAYS